MGKRGGRREIESEMEGEKREMRGRKEGGIKMELKRRREKGRWKEGANKTHLLAMQN